MTWELMCSQYIDYANSDIDINAVFSSSLLIVKANSSQFSNSKYRIGTLKTYVAIQDIGLVNTLATTIYFDTRYLEVPMLNSSSYQIVFVPYTYVRQLTLNFYQGS